jgi:hypothetical protein
MEDRPAINIYNNNAESMQPLGLCEYSKKNISYKKGVKYYILFISASIILLYVLNNLQYIGIQFINDTYISCLWAVNLFLTLSIIGNFVLLIFRPFWFHYLLRIIIFSMAIFALYTIYQIFPFDIRNNTIAFSIKSCLGLLSILSFILIIEGFIRYIKSLKAIL